MITATIILFLSVFISAISQILLKKSALKKWKNSLREYLNLYVITAYTIFFTAVFLDLLALRKVNLSLVPVAEASSYIFVIILSRIFLKEKLSKLKALAILLIVTGIIIFLY
ncbi:multidrug ABC transporter [Treponema rectale]|uniref:Drug/metabolite transporter (DMT)-like permease n=1 Tax=Treponema rectale TaxID=744512 RepID=A0A840SCH1_9SPIR|nr:EamA family transporter [Treponema rectale]MBB5218420.1 drug/metabolite transporter (DMT)-like permease [Treponema rectale]QOS39888.1 multidrug ABC transporter [Treponema rectale]